MADPDVTAQNTPAPPVAGPGGAPAVAYAATALADYDQVSSAAGQKATRSYGP